MIHQYLRFKKNITYSELFVKTFQWTLRSFFFVLTFFFYKITKLPHILLLLFFILNLNSFDYINDQSLKHYMFQTESTN